jgi:hypothetical protein
MESELTIGNSREPNLCNQAFTLIIPQRDRASHPRAGQLSSGSSRIGAKEVFGEAVLSFFSDRAAFNTGYGSMRMSFLYYTADSN